jgi:hypothetical protein
VSRTASCRACLRRHSLGEGRCPAKRAQGQNRGELRPRNHTQSRPCARPTGPHKGNRPKGERATATMVLKGSQASLGGRHVALPRGPGAARVEGAGGVTTCCD